MSRRDVAKCAAALLALMAIGVHTALAGEADVIAVDAHRSSDGTYRFNVTVRHMDTGWEHYADRWDIVAPDGTVIASRVLAHPHVDEQPFTRSLSGVRIPDGVTQVTIRAHDNVHELGGNTITINIP